MDLESLALSPWSASAMCHHCGGGGQPNKARAQFFHFFVVQEGVIRYSLRDLTTLCTFVITLSFLAMLYLACSNEDLECSIAELKLPMISDVVALPVFDRIFILLTTVYFMGVH